MDKSTLREVEKARHVAQSHPRYAAVTMSTLLRSATSKKVIKELEAILDELKLRPHLEVVNGCYVAKSGSSGSLAAATDTLPTA